jgi:hypothetical protein
MAIKVANTELTSTFDFWRSRTNELADAMTTKVVSCNSLPTVGNSAITGNFQAGTITVGNNSTTKVLINPPTASDIASGYVLSANGSWIPAAGGVKTGTAVGANAVVVDTLDIDDFSAADYKIYMKASSSNSHSYSKISLLQDLGNVLTTEYAMLATNGQLGIVTANINTGQMRLYITPQVTGGVTYRINRSLM